MKKHLIFLSLLLCFNTSYAAVYFASPNGTSDGSSINKPCSFSNGVKKLTSAGDTLYLLGGQYNLNNTKLSNLKGNSNKNIVISGYANEKAILDFRTTPYGTRGLQVNNTCAYLHIKNLTLRYSGKNNLYNEASNCTFENLDIYGSADTGCQMKNGGNNIIKNVDSHDNFDYQHLNDAGLADFGGNADGFADKQFTGAGNHYIGCRAWNNSDDGWDFFQRITNGTNTIIEDCICYQNGAPYYNMTNHPRYQTDKAWFDAYVGKQVTDRYGNTITISLDKYPNQGNGNGFKMGGYYTNHLVEIHHCLAVGNYAKGFDQNNNDGTMWVYNCTGFANAANYGFTTAYGTNYIRNCISLKSQGNDSYKSKNNAANDHNTWISGFSCSAADFISIDTTNLISQRNNDGSLPESSFMHLKDGSKLIDAGVDVGLNYYGTAPDLGCYETDGIQRPIVTCISNNLTQNILLGQPIQPIVFEWSGAATRLTCSAKPDGIEHKISNNNHTLTLSGTPTAIGSFTITITTVSDSDNQSSLTATINIKPANTKQIAYVTIPSSTADQLVLNKITSNDLFLLTETDATLNDVDYSNYDLIILSGVPNSTEPAYATLKGYNKPMLILKPFLFKNTVWNWGTPLNTQDLTITITHPEHPIFQNITTDNNQLTIFSDCNTNAITAITDWNNTSPVTTLATPLSYNNYTTIAELTTGTNCNGTTLLQPIIIFGISEYSTFMLTNNALQLIENMVYYLLNISIPTQNNTITQPTTTTTKKILTPNGMIIQRNNTKYTITGQTL